MVLEPRLTNKTIKRSIRTPACYQQWKWSERRQDKLDFFYFKYQSRECTLLMCPGHKPQRNIHVYNMYILYQEGGKEREIFLWPYPTIWLFWLRSPAIRGSGSFVPSRVVSSRPIWGSIQLPSKMQNSVMEPTHDHRFQPLIIDFNHILAQNSTANHRFLSLFQHIFKF